jgi:hypothetical protein
MKNTSDLRGCRDAAMQRRQQPGPSVLYAGRYLRVTWKPRNPQCRRS